MVGGAQKVLDMSVEYAKVRVQFGRPIGSFQAIKHKCADMLLEVESAKSAAYYAAGTAAEDSDELPVIASLAKAYCSDAYFHAAAENIQIHGGIGFTWEHDAHLYFKRAKSSEILLGDATYHRERLAHPHRYLTPTPRRVGASTLRVRSCDARVGCAARGRDRPSRAPGSGAAPESRRDPAGAARPGRRSRPEQRRCCHESCRRPHGAIAFGALAPRAPWRRHRR